VRKRGREGGERKKGKNVCVCVCNEKNEIRKSLLEAMTKTT